jgi:hypothetical protein
MKYISNTNDKLYKICKGKVFCLFFLKTRKLHVLLVALAHLVFYNIRVKVERFLISVITKTIRIHDGRLMIYFVAEKFRSNKASVCDHLE